MRIVLYCPLNDPDDGGTSGDRRMARQIRSALQMLGHEVETLVRPRTHVHAPDGEAFALLEQAAAATGAELAQGWLSQARAPDLWLTYHNYHKAPDLLGPRLCATLSIPYVIVEASHTPSKREGDWARRTAAASKASLAADLHLCFTAQDRHGLAGLLGGQEQLMELPPFIDTAPFGSLRPSPGNGAPRLLSVAMMRPGWKRDSYRALAQAMAGLTGRPWSLTLVGDGPARAQVEGLFAGFGSGCVSFLGLVSHDRLPGLMAAHDIFVWPGLHEPFGLVFLEAQAAGLPVVAFDSGGVGATVRAGETAMLVPEGDVQAFADAVTRLGSDRALRQQMAVAARAFVLEERGLHGAGTVIRQALARASAHRSAQVRERA